MRKISTCASARTGAPDQVLWVEWSCAQPTHPEWLGVGATCEEALVVPSHRAPGSVTEACDLAHGPRSRPPAGTHACSPRGPSTGADSPQWASPFIMISSSQAAHEDALPYL